MTRRLCLFGIGLAAVAGPTGALARSRGVPAPAPIPQAYRAVGKRMGVPPLILYGVALQESKMKFGEVSLPYPWTLCVAGEGRRFASYQQAVLALRKAVLNETRNVDCGLMQVNWRWHSHRLQTPELALDAYKNLMIGAQILLEQRAASENWFAAVGRYHHPTNRERALNYASSVFKRLKQIPPADQRAPA